MRIGIVGSREYPSESSVREFVRSLPSGTVIVSGGARGVDSWAASEARKRGLKVVEHKPDYDRYPGKIAPIMRNTTIAEDSDEIAAFWDGQSRGTMDTVRKAEAAGKPVSIFGLTPEIRVSKREAAL